MEARGVLETAHRASQNVSQVMRYAIATGRAERDPVPDLRDLLGQDRCFREQTVERVANQGTISTPICAQLCVF